ncbi:MAG: hypothetical protein M9933_01365 [Chitinophagaceae bacterium]|nr:hypothetical protein [Chitinophagaceae bacterium]
MCRFQYLYNGEDGYVVRCHYCGNYQLAFASIMLTLTKNEYRSFCDLVEYKCDSAYETAASETSKCVVLPTPAPGTFILLTRDEAARLGTMLEEADNENKALMLMNLFNEPDKS